MSKKFGGLEIFTVEDLSKILDIQEKTLRQLLKDGKLKGRKLARRWYVTEDHLREYFSQPEAYSSEDDGDTGQ
jgi:hypothetical protein